MSRRCPRRLGFSLAATRRALADLQLNPLRENDASPWFAGDKGPGSALGSRSPQVTYLGGVHGGGRQRDPQAGGGP